MKVSLKFHVILGDTLLTFQLSLKLVNWDYFAVNYLIIFLFEYSKLPNYNRTVHHVSQNIWGGSSENCKFSKLGHFNILRGLEWLVDRIMNQPFVSIKLIYVKQFRFKGYIILEHITHIASLNLFSRGVVQKARLI